MSNNKNELIEKFMKITKISNNDFAFGYLKKYDFDLEKSIDLFFENNGINPCEIKENNESDNTNSKLFGILSLPNFLSIQMFKNCKRNENNSIDEKFTDLPSLINKKDFENYLDKKLCLYFLYDEDSKEEMKDLLNVIKNNSYINFKIEKYCVTLFNSFNSSNIELFLDDNLKCPIVLFCYNNINEKKFNKKSIKENFDGKKNVNEFPQFFFDTLKNYLFNLNKTSSNDNLEFNEKTINNEEINTKINEEKKEEIKIIKNEINLNNNINNEIKFNQIYNQNNIPKLNKIFYLSPFEAKNKLPEEPNLLDNDIVVILFLFPNHNRKQRNFLKSDKLEIVYTYLISLGKELYSELNSNYFYLALTRPYIPLKENYFNTTLSELNFNKTQLLIIINDT